MPGVYGASGGARNGHTTLPEVALIEVRRTIPAGPDRVFAVLADGWMYAAWVVGAAHVRDVDPQWPAVGARIHHSLGPWPLMMHDVTKVLNVEPDRMLELDARMWPAGAARVKLTLTPDGQGHTDVRMEEEVVSGPLSLVPSQAQALVLRPRNNESLHRLADMAVNRKTGAQS